MAWYHWQNAISWLVAAVAVALSFIASMVKPSVSELVVGRMSMMPVTLEGQRCSVTWCFIASLFANTQFTYLAWSETGTRSTGSRSPVLVYGCDLHGAVEQQNTDDADVMMEPISLVYSKVIEVIALYEYHYESNIYSHVCDEKH